MGMECDAFDGGFNRGLQQSHNENESIDSGCSGCSARCAAFNECSIFLSSFPLAFNGFESGLFEGPNMGLVSGVVNFL
jgi:hypothetical protein